MKINNNIVYINNNQLGYYENTTFHVYNNDEKNDLLCNIEKDIKKKDYNRKIFSKIIGLFLLLVLITLFVLILLNKVNIGTNKWFNFTFIILGMCLVWVILYNLFGLFFYKRLKLNFYFKDPNSNKCFNYASSKYRKFVDKYYQYVGKPSNDNKVISLKSPKAIDDIIFNGKILSNIPYFYIIDSNKRFLFMPLFLIIVDNNNTKVIEYNKLNVNKKDNEYSLSLNENIILNINFNDFDINFFYQNY